MKMIDGEEAIRRMTKLIELYSKHGYGDVTKYNTAVEHCCGVIQGMMKEAQDDEIQSRR
jgi:hypothetical protein